MNKKLILVHIAYCTIFHSSLDKEHKFDRVTLCSQESILMPSWLYINIQSIFWRMRLRISSRDVQFMLWLNFISFSAVVFSTQNIKKLIFTYHNKSLRKNYNQYLLPNIQTIQLCVLNYSLLNVSKIQFA